MTRLRRLSAQGPVRYLLLAALAVGLLLVPVISPTPYVQRVVNLILIYVILTLGQNLLTGFTGLISLGQAGFYAIGAYTSALLVMRVGVPWLVAFLASGILACLVGIVLGYPTLRVGGDYLTLMTIGFAEIVRVVALNWMAVTRGPMGMPGVPAPSIGSFSFFTGPRVYYLFLSIAAIAYLGVWLMVNSKIGRAFKAIREDEIAAEASGLDVAYYKILSFATAALLAGFAGSLLAHFNAFVGPASFNIDESLLQMNMALLGGLGSLPGSVLGATILTAAPELFRVISQYRLLFMGLLMGSLMIWRPNGIMGRDSAVVAVTNQSRRFRRLFEEESGPRRKSWRERITYALIGD